METTTIRTASFGPRVALGARIARIRRWPATLLIGGAILLVYIVVALTAQFWAPYSYSQVATGIPLSGPSLKHLFGVDQLGRDVFS
ncbi:MAG TPA: hypothetical protein VFD70_06285, partial [Anaerolineae bacterium]|nr:hypothetical protein [Anaerolineae bacterium]